MLFDAALTGIPGSGRFDRETEDRKSKGKNAFGRQKIVETGLVRQLRSQPWMAVSGSVLQ
jgi:hypothetical protein